MLFAGVDIGSLTAEAVVIDDAGAIVASALGPSLADPVASARSVLQLLRQQPGLGADGFDVAVATGYGRQQVQDAGLADTHVSEISCHGLGALAAAPEGAAVRTVIDVGGQDAKVVRINERGDLLTFAMNDKCAAGTGHFLELMSRALGVKLEQLGRLSLTGYRPVEMSRRCSIFVETEVLHHLQRGVPRADVAAGITRAMAERVVALARRVGTQREVMMTGGVAKNIAVRRALEQRLGHPLLQPKIDPQLIGAHGAALLARRRWAEAGADRRRGARGARG